MKSRTDKKTPRPKARGVWLEDWLEGKFFSNDAGAVVIGRIVKFNLGFGFRKAIRVLGGIRCFPDQVSIVVDEVNRMVFDFGFPHSISPSIPDQHIAGLSGSPIHNVKELIYFDLTSHYTIFVDPSQHLISRRLQ